MVKPSEVIDYQEPTEPTAAQILLEKQQAAETLIRSSIDFINAELQSGTLVYENGQYTIVLPGDLIAYQLFTEVGVKNVRKEICEYFRAEGWSSAHHGGDRVFLTK